MASMANLSSFIFNPFLSTSRARNNYYHFRASPKLFKITMFNHQTYWSSAEAEMQAHLLKFLPKASPPALLEVTQYLTSTASKTIAPMVCLAACVLVGGNKEVSMDAACALHLVHVASFAHDQLPALGGPRANFSSDYSTAVMLLCHDSIHPLAYEFLAQSKCPDPGHIVRAMVEVAKATAANGILEGQYMEINSTAMDENSAEKICEKRGGGLSACGAACGAILGGGRDDAVEKLRRFGFYIGMMHGLQQLDGKADATDRFRSLAKMALEELELQEDKVEMAMGLLDFVGLSQY